MSVAFELESVGMTYGSTVVLQEISLSFPRSGFVAIAGPNGAGKSTVLGIMGGLRSGYSGKCAYQGVEVSLWKRQAFARVVSFVPQSLRLDFPFTAEQVVLMGRTPYAGGLFENEQDWQAVRRAMSLTDTEVFRDRDFRSLSGGERQRVVLASALAQEPRVLLLDEPTTFLDLSHQIATYRLLRDLSRTGLLVVSVTHDLNLAASFADRVIALRGGRLLADDVPCDALTIERVREIFNVEAEWLTRSDGIPWLSYGA